MVSRTLGGAGVQGFETVLTWEAAHLSGPFRSFVEVFAFLMFGVGVSLNTVLLTGMISMWPNIDSLDACMMNLTVADLISSFGLAFVFFVRFTTKMASIGTPGCQFLDWLAVTCVGVTSIALVVAIYELHRRLRGYEGSWFRGRWRMPLTLATTWLVAALPGIAYADRARMMSSNVCASLAWSTTSELVYIAALFFVQLVVPLAVCVVLFVRLVLHFRVPDGGGADGVALEEDSPGSEASVLRGALQRRCRMLGAMAAFLFSTLVLAVFLELALVLDLGELSERASARMRVIVELLLCCKACALPVIVACLYDKLRARMREICCRRRVTHAHAQEAYNSLRFDVYQQTVSEPAHLTTLPLTDGSDGRAEDVIRFDEHFETERDDVAIIDAEVYDR